MEETRKIIQIARDMVEGWRQIDGLYLIHQPDVSIAAISSEKFNI
jgi:hypothetical protein